MTPDQPTEAAAGETTQVINGHHIAYRAHWYECVKCGARMLSMMQFQTRECPGPAPSPVPSQSEPNDLTEDEVAAEIHRQLLANETPVAPGPPKRVRRPAPSQSVAAEVEGYQVDALVELMESKYAYQRGGRIVPLVRARAEAILAAGYLSPKQVAQREREAARKARAEQADWLWRRVFLQLPNTPSPLSDEVQRKVIELRDRAEGASDAE